MDKERIVNELNNYVQAIDKQFSVEYYGGNLNLDYNDFNIACFSYFYEKEFRVSPLSFETAKLIFDNNILKLFYDKAFELLNESEKKYTIKVVNNDRGYLFFDDIAKEYSFANKNNKFFKSYFTQSEIEQLKQRDDIAIDWDKAIIEEA